MGMCEPLLGILLPGEKVNVTTGFGIGAQGKSLSLVVAIPLMLYARVHETAEFR